MDPERREAIPFPIQEDEVRVAYADTRGHGDGNKKKSFEPRSRIGGRYSNVPYPPTVDRGADLFLDLSIR